MADDLLSPDNSGNDTEIMALIDDTYDDYKQGRAPFERQWYRNILFLIGNQWVMWDAVESKWRKKRLANWVPTPVTNKFASSGQRLVSVLSRIEPNWEFAPASDSEEDVVAASQCDLAETIICEENHIENVRQKVASWVAYTGNCYLLSGVEPIMADIPELPIIQDMAADAPPDVQDLIAEITPEPEPVDYKLYTDVLSPFEVYVDQTVESFDDQSKVLVVNRRSPEYVQKLWGVDIDADEEAGLNYKETIGYLTSDPTITSYLAGTTKVKRITVKRLFMRPSKDYPDGLYAVKAGNQILEQGALPKTKEGKSYIPIAEIKFDTVPGAAFGRTPLDDIIQKQVQRNKIESLIELIALRMSSPIWLMPEGTAVQNFSGAPGAIVKYSMIGEKATKPDRIPGEQIPASIIQFLSIIDKDIEDLVSTFEALKGQSPYSGAPGVVIEQLIEQGLTRFGPSLRNIAEGYRQWMLHQLEFFRQYGIVERTIAKAGSGQKWSVEKFKGADIVGAVDIRIESDSTIPRSSQVEVAKIIAAMNARLIDVTNPMVRLKVLQKLRISELMEDIDNDVIAATKENESVAQGGMIKVSPFLDNHPIHISKHKLFAQSDAGARFKPIIMKHIAEHNMVMDAEMNGDKKVPPGEKPPQKPGQSGRPGQPQRPQNGPSGQGGPSGAKISPKGANDLNPGANAPMGGTLPPGIA